jgi:hypothetical protein
LFFTEATVPDSRTKYESAQLLALISGRSKAESASFRPRRIHAMLTLLLRDINKLPLFFSGRSVGLSRSGYSFVGGMRKPQGRSFAGFNLLVINKVTGDHHEKSSCSSLRVCCVHRGLAG